MKEGGKPGTHGGDSPPGIWQHLGLAWWLLRVIFAAHDYIGRLVLRYDHGISWPPLGVKLVAVNLPLLHVAFWALRLDSHRYAGPEYREVGPVMACFYPLLGLAIYRTIRSQFSTQHSYYGGFPYLCRLLGGDELRWRTREAFLVIAATYPALRLGVPFAAFVGCTGVGMLIQGIVSRVDHGRTRRAIRDGRIEGELLMD